MKILLDTHGFLWWNQNQSQLCPRALSAIRDSNNEVWISVAAVWEIQIKQQIGKLKINAPLDEFVRVAVERDNIKVLSITTDHVLGLDNLPLYYRDPFDRIMIAQAIFEGATLISADHAFHDYPVTLLW